jgi:hypothetical protein
MVSLDKAMYFSAFSHQQKPMPILFKVYYNAATKAGQIAEAY